jgi:succinate dehydrogenase flavin-adding protein (antitoxin of CptAB toxin-antitoxin module)
MRRLAWAGKLGLLEMDHSLGTDTELLMRHGKETTNLAL